MVLCRCLLAHSYQQSCSPTVDIGGCFLCCDERFGGGDGDGDDDDDHRKTCRSRCREKREPLDDDDCTRHIDFGFAACHDCCQMISFADFFLGDDNQCSEQCHVARTPNPTTTTTAHKPQEKPTKPHP